MKRIYKSLMTGLLLVAGSILPLQAQVSIFLTDNMFKGWDGVGADAVSLSSEIPEMNIGSEIGAGVTVYGNPVVDPLAYADLTGYEKIVFEGTPGIQLRVLMNRELGGEYGSFNGAYIEENPVIGEDGKAEVDLTPYSYVHLNAIKTGWESSIGTITAIKLVNQEEDAPYNPDEVSIFLTDNMFKGWDGVGADAVSLSSEIPEMNIGSEIGAGVTVYGNPVVDPLAYADLTGYEKMVFEGTPGMQLRVLMNRELGGEYGSFNGAYIEENPVIGEDGKAEVDLTPYSYVHLNAIKTGWESSIGTITAIKLINQEEDAPYNPDEGGDNPDNPNEGGENPDNPNEGGENSDNPNEGEFNPTNPADPHMNYKVKTAVEPQSAGAWINVWDENWDGHYRYGEKITLKCPATNGSYSFTHWTLDGEQYSTDPYITYTMGSSSVNFVAHYEFKPEDPNDPSYTANNRLYLKADPITACTFNQPSGQKWNYETSIYLCASPNSGYKFEGWYYKGNLYSKSLDFNFQMPDEEVTFVARFEYNPENPGDPFGDGSQSNVENKPKGDANRDGEVDVADAVRIINLCLANEKEAEADVNGDGEVDVADAVAVINLCLKYK